MYVELTFKLSNIAKTGYVVTSRMHALRSAGENFDVQKMEECFREIDKDDSGLIDFEEYIEVSRKFIK